MGNGINQVEGLDQMLHDDGLADSRQVFVGIDSGKLGALVALNENRKVVAWADTPLLPMGRGKAVYDRIMMSFMLYYIAKAAPRMDIVVEQPITKPLRQVPRECGKCKEKIWIQQYDKPSVIAVQFAGYSLWVGMIAMLQSRIGTVGFTELKPSVWHKELFGTMTNIDPKAQAVEYANRNWPHGPWRGPRGGIKEDRCDAVCLADTILRRFVSVESGVRIGKVK